MKHSVIINLSQQHHLKHNKNIIFIDPKSDSNLPRIKELKGCKGLISILHPEWCMLDLSKAFNQFYC